MNYLTLTLDRTWDKASIDSGLDFLPAPVRNSEDDEGMLLFARKPKTEESSISEAMHVLQRADPGEKASAVECQLMKNLSDRGLITQSIIWPPNLDDLKDKHIISLLELTGPMLSEISSANFTALKSVVTQCSSFSWVSTGQDPAMHAALGFLRTLRNENPTLSLRFVLLEERDDQSAKELADVITKVAITSSIDSEFVELGGNMCINRWVAEDALTAVTVTDEADTIQGYITLGESRKPLKLVNAHYESPKALYFTVEDEASQRLGNNEVEIEVKAVLLK